MGRLLRHKRAGEDKVAWHRVSLKGPDTLELRSDAFAEGGSIPLAHAGPRVGGQNISPALTWTPAPAETVDLLLVVEDPDAPWSYPPVHAIAVLDPKMTALPAGALDPKAPADGVRLLRSMLKPGYTGPEPVKGHGPHRYVFQLFALAHPLGRMIAGREDHKVSPRLVLDAVPGPVLARGRLDGFYER